MTSMVGTEKIQEQLYFLDINQKTIKLGELTSDNFSHLVEAFVQEKFNSKLNMVKKTKIDIQNDKTFLGEYYLFENKSLYKKEIAESKGYLWNSATPIMKKIGKFVTISVTLPSPIYITQPKEKKNNKEKIKNRKQKKASHQYNYMMQKRKNNFKKKLKHSVNNY
ncbi:hypothetical protein Catovirus_1_684 [Catovirus CTV1]|uniref:Uncharacterized protein n=1 Tax=Catovirus CTV1 TaxID=1977631 RepID=A0A1V0SAD0_9VIRU|nr:hypothetical protein Catovirus_1_684 [Catovirus CTV1]